MAVQKLQPGQGSLEVSSSAILKDMDARIAYYQGASQNLEYEIKRIDARLKALGGENVFQKYSNDINWDYVKGKTSDEMKELLKKRDLCLRELESLKPLLETMLILKTELMKARKELAGADVYLPDGTINGFHPLVQKILGITDAFFQTDAYAKALTWNMAARGEDEARQPAIGPAAETYDVRQSQQKALDIIQRGLDYLDVLERNMKKLTNAGGAQADYINAEDRGTLVKELERVREILVNAKKAANRGDVKEAAKLIRQAAEEQQKIDQNYNRVMAEALQYQYVKEKGSWYEKVKYEVTPVGDWAAFAAPVVGGLIGGVAGARGGPLGVVAGVQRGAAMGGEAASLWWGYRGLDGVATAAINGRLFSLECAESLAIVFLSASHLPGASKLRWLKPAQKYVGYGMMATMTYHAGSEVLEAAKHDWFFTGGQRKQFVFYGGIITFSLASMIPSKVMKSELFKGKIEGEFNAFREIVERGDTASVTGNSKRWVGLAENIEAIAKNVPENERAQVLQLAASIRETVRLAQEAETLKKTPVKTTTGKKEYEPPNVTRVERLDRITFADNQGVSPVVQANLNEFSAGIDRLTSPYRKTAPETSISIPFTISEDGSIRLMLDRKKIPAAGADGSIIVKADGTIQRIDLWSGIYERTTPKKLESMLATMRISATEHNKKGPAPEIEITKKPGTGTPRPEEAGEPGSQAIARVEPSEGVADPQVVAANSKVLNMENIDRAMSGKTVAFHWEGEEFVQESYNVPHTNTIYFKFDKKTGEIIEINDFIPHRANDWSAYDSVMIEPPSTLYRFGLSREIPSKTNLAGAFMVNRDTGEISVAIPKGASANAVRAIEESVSAYNKSIRGNRRPPRAGAPYQPSAP